MYTWFTVLILYVQSISSIMLRPYPVATVRYGRQLLLECETNNDWISLSWRKNVQTYVFVFNQNNCNTTTDRDFLKATCDERENITFSSLIDINPKKNDTWECLAVFSGNEIRQNRTKVDIIGPYVELSNQTDVLYGDPAKLNCTMDPKWSRCTWKKSENDQEILSVTSCTNKTTLNYYLLCIGNDIILHVEFPVHLSSYECVGFYYTDDGLVSTKEETTVVIYADPPSLQISSEPLNPVEHFDFELQCIATGRPTPTTSWIILDSEIEQGLGRSKIQFHNLKRTDSKEITCRATATYLNTTMEAEIQYNMTVLYPPEARIIGKTVNQSDNIQLEYLVESGKPAKYNVTGWEQRVEGKLIRTLNITDNHLNFTKISIFDTGQYSCFVSNGINDGDGDILIKGSGNLSVHGSPYIVAGLKVYEVSIGEDAKIEVTVLSFPPLEHARLSKTGSTGRIDMNLHSFMSYISFYGVDVLLSVQNATYSFSVTTEKIGQYSIELENEYFTENFYLEIKSESTNSQVNYLEKKTDTTVTVVSSVIGVVVFLFLMVLVIVFYRRTKYQSKKTGKGSQYEQPLKESEREKRYVTLDKLGLHDDGTYLTPEKIDIERSNTDSRKNKNTGQSSFSKKCEQKTEASSGYVELTHHYEEIGMENTENGNCYETIKDPLKTIQRKQTDLIESNYGNADVKTKEKFSEKPDLPPRSDKNKVSEEETFSNNYSNVAKSSSDADHDRKENPDNKRSSDFNAKSVDNLKEKTKRPNHEGSTVLENPDNEKSSDFYSSSLNHSKEKTKGAKHELSSVSENPDNEKSSDFYSSSLDTSNSKEKIKGAKHELSTVSENPDNEKSSDFCSTSLDNSKVKTKGAIHELSTVSENPDNEKSSDFCSTSLDNSKEKTKGHIHDASIVSDDSNSAKASGISVLIDSIGFQKRALPKTENFNTQDAKRSLESNNYQERPEGISSDQITQL